MFSILARNHNIGSYATTHCVATYSRLVLIDVDSLKFDSSMVLMAELFAKERANSSKSIKNSAAVVLD